MFSSPLPHCPFWHIFLTPFVKYISCSTWGLPEQFWGIPSQYSWFNHRFKDYNMVISVGEYYLAYYSKQELETLVVFHGVESPTNSTPLAIRGAKQNICFMKYCILYWCGVNFAIAIYHLLFCSSVYYGTEYFILLIIAIHYILFIHICKPLSYNNAIFIPYWFIIYDYY